MKKLILTALLLPAILLGNAFAQSGGEGGAYLKHGFGARANSMGNAFTGVANDVSAIFYNSAGLYQLKKSEGLLMYSKLFNDVDGLTYGNFAVAHPFKFGTLAFGTAYMQVSDIPYVSSPSGPDGSTFADNQIMVMASYSNIIEDFLMLGGTLKFVNHSLAGYSGSGFGVDLGVFTKFNQYLSAGISVENAIQPTINMNNSSYKYPVKGRLGVGAYPVKGLTLSSELNFMKDKDVIFGVGAEYSFYNDMILARAGYNTLSSSVSFGAGINYKGVGFDYSFNTNKDLGSVSKFGLIVKLDLISL